MRPTLWKNRSSPVICRAWCGFPAPPSNWTLRTTHISGPDYTLWQTSNVVEIPGSSAEESIIRGWRLFKRLLHYTIEGERIFTGFAFLPPHKSLSEQQRRWPNLLLYHESDQVLLNEGIEAIKQLLLNADGRTTFLSVYQDRIVGVLYLPEGTQRQLTTVRSWRDSLPLATISRRGRFNFWLALKGRHNARIPLSLLEYRQGRIQIPLFQDVFWQELERQLRGICPDCRYPEVLQQFKQLLRGLRTNARGGILLVGLTAAKLQEPYVPIENEVAIGATNAFTTPVECYPPGVWPNPTVRSSLMKNWK